MGLVEHLFDPPVHRGVKGTIPRRDIVDPILWLARRLSRCYEQTPLGAQTWLEVACVAYLCGRPRAEPT